MLSPKKGLVFNLNHVQLQHISLGLQLSRWPGLQESPVPLAPGKGTPCSDCPETVDANSNNPSVPCRCCPEQGHTLGRHQGPLPDVPSPQGVAEAAAASPSEPTSSSLSTCSELSLDGDTPVSVYCKEFPPPEELLSPDNQPTIVPLEDGHNAPPEGTRPQASPDSLCSSSSSLATPSDTGSPPSTDTQPSPRDQASPVGTELDSNCNALPPFTAELLDLNQNRAALPQLVRESAPPPVPPRTKRGLQGGPALPPAQGETVGRNVTSFHELAQKRKRGPAGPRRDQSDWLIVFSPDTELPPPSELSLPHALARPLSQQGVTTFKELRYRKQKGQPGRDASNGDGQQDPDWALAPPPNGHFLALLESQPRRKKSRPGLQPIAEGNAGEVEAVRAEGKAAKGWC
uniref:Uncharacterized protein n=1 Tax=Sphenodon punctatus TaxID=8508 RepID=A0A8D0HI55_SPHPU